MAILNTIRKRTSVLIIVISLALFSFVISGIFSSNAFTSSDVASSIAEVNDQPIGIEDFRRSLEIATNSYGQNFSNTRLVNIVFDQELRKQILSEQYSALGFEIEGDQIIDFMRNSGFANIPDFQDEEGFFDPYVAKATIANWKATNPVQYEAWLTDEANIINSAKEQMYFNFIKAGIHTTVKEGASVFKFQNNKVSFDYVQLPYNLVPDSLVSVSKDEISAYIKDNPKQFKQEEARDIQFVYFEEKPSKGDEEAVLAEIQALLEDREEYNEQSGGAITVQGFRSTDEVERFVELHSDVPFVADYLSSDQLPSVASANIITLSKGDVYGPYKDGNSYKVSRLMDSKPNGSVRSSHILVAYKGAERAATTIERTKEEARAKAQEYLTRARKGDESFANLAKEGSDGPTASRGGDLGFVTEGVMVDAFNDFIFKNPVGRIGLVETQFGFHVVKVEAKKDVYQVATLVRRIDPSENTINTLFADATSFEMKTSEGSVENFTNVATELGYSARPVTQLKKLDENLPQLGEQRAIVRWAFGKDTQVGDVERFDIAGGYVIAQVSKVYAEGLQSPEDASAIVLPLLKNQKKAEQLRKQYASESLDNLKAIDAVRSGTALAMTSRSSVISGVGPEPSVVGKALSMNVGEVSPLIEGAQGMFKVVITDKNDAITLPNFAPFTETINSQRLNRAIGNAYNALREKAEIVDNRILFY